MASRGYSYRRQKREAHRLEKDLDYQARSKMDELRKRNERERELSWEDLRARELQRIAETNRQVARQGPDARELQRQSQAAAQQRLDEARRARETHERMIRERNERKR